MTVEDEKYVVFKKDEFEQLMTTGLFIYGISEALGKRILDVSYEQNLLRDAVVIRRQDSFAAAALRTYANSIAATIDVMHDLLNLMPHGQEYDSSVNNAKITITNRIKHLKNIADYFNEQADQAEADGSRLPD